MHMRPLLAAVLLGCLALATPAADVTPQEQATFEKHLDKLVTMQLSRIESPAIAPVFAGTFYNVTLKIADNQEELVCALKEDELFQVSKPHTNADMPDLAKLLQPKFKLAKDPDAKTFQAALDAVYPINTQFDKDNEKAKTIKHSGRTWSFVRGKFFDHFEGFVVSTKPDGTIATIAYSLEIK